MSFDSLGTEAEAWVGNLRKETSVWGKEEAPGPKWWSVGLRGGTQQPGLTRLCSRSGSQLPTPPLLLLQAFLDSATMSCSHSNCTSGAVAVLDS